MRLKVSLESNSQCCVSPDWKMSWFLIELATKLIFEWYFWKNFFNLHQNHLISSTSGTWQCDPYILTGCSIIVKTGTASEAECFIYNDAACQAIQDIQQNKPSFCGWLFLITDWKLKSLIIVSMSVEVMCGVFAVCTNDEVWHFHANPLKHLVGWYVPKYLSWWLDIMGKYRMSSLWIWLKLWLDSWHSCILSIE